MNKRFGEGRCCQCGKKAYKSVCYRLLCKLHWKINNIRTGARMNKKYVPTEREIVALFKANPKRICPSCDRKMDFCKTDGRVSLSMTFQHNRDGTFGLLCHGCNARHASYKGDSFYKVPKDHKHCKGCGKIKSLNAFYTGPGCDGWKKTSQRCKDCARARGKKFYYENLELCRARARNFNRKKFGYSPRIYK